MKDTYEGGYQEQQEELVFDLETREGVAQLLNFLESLALEENSALAEGLDVSQVDWPEEGIGLLKNYRLNYSDLLRQLRDLAVSKNELTSEEVGQLTDVYEEYVNAEAAFAEYQEGYVAEESDGDAAPEMSASDTSLETDMLTPAESDPAAVVTLQEPGSEVEEQLTEEQLVQYKREQRKQLVPILMARGWDHAKISSFLDKSFGRETTVEGVDRVIFNINNDPLWDQTVVLPEPVSDTDSTLVELDVTRAVSHESSGPASAIIDIEPVQPESATEKPFRLTPEMRVSEPVELENLSTAMPEIPRETELAENLFESTYRIRRLTAQAIDTAEQLSAQYIQRFPRTVRSLEENQQLDLIKSLQNRAEEIDQKVEQTFGAFDQMAVKKAALRNYEQATTRILEELAQISVSESGPQQLDNSFEKLAESADQARQQLLRNPFYTPEERTTAEFFLQNYEAAKRNGATIDQLTIAAKNLTEFVEQLDKHPSIAYLRERIEKIVAKLAVVSQSESDLVQSVTSMKEQFDRLSQQPQLNEQSLINTYQIIEKLALDSEQSWLTVCGMHLPSAGPQGVFGARSFRDGLAFVKERHQDLVNSPAKQVLVDKIINKLANVPAEGISEEVLREITELARQINIDTGVVGNFKRLPVSEGNESVSTVAQPEEDVTESDQELEAADDLPQPRRGKLIPAAVDPAEEAESQVTITVQTNVESEIPLAEEDQEPETNAAIDQAQQSAPLPSGALTWRERAEANRQQELTSGEGYLNTDAEIAEIESIFGSVKEFRRKIDSEVSRIDSMAGARWSWLRDDEVSPYRSFEKEPVAHFLRLSELRRVTGRDANKAQQAFSQELEKRRITKDAFIAWETALTEYLNRVRPQTDTMTVAELLAQFILMSERGR